MAAAIPTETVSSLDEVDAVLTRMGINTVDGINQVAFRLHERSSLVAATRIKRRTQVGREGFTLKNPELVDRKFETKAKLEEAFEQMLAGCVNDCEREIQALEPWIAEVRTLLLLPEDQIQDAGTDIMRRNQGLMQVIYPSPPFPENVPYEYHPAPAPRMQFQDPYGTDAERNAARSRDRRSQKAWWHTNLALLEEKKQILQKERIDMEFRLRVVLKTALEEESDLGAGYVNFDFRYGTPPP